MVTAMVVVLEDIGAVAIALVEEEHIIIIPVVVAAAEAAAEAEAVCEGTFISPLE